MSLKCGYYSFDIYTFCLKIKLKNKRVSIDY